MPDKLAFRVDALDVFIGINGLLHVVAISKTVALVVSPPLVTYLAPSLQDIDFRFWVAVDDRQADVVCAKLETEGYKIVHVDRANVRDTYKSLGVSPTAMIGGASFQRDNDAETKQFEKFVSKHPSYVLVEGRVSHAVLPDGIPKLRLTCERLTDARLIIDHALHVHSTGGPLIVLADVLKLKCTRYLHAETTSFPFRRVVQVV